MCSYIASICMVMWPRMNAPFLTAFAPWMGAEAAHATGSTEAAVITVGPGAASHQAGTD